jgi:hypothetical protein
MRRSGNISCREHRNRTNNHHAQKQNKARSLNDGTQGYRKCGTSSCDKSKSKHQLDYELDYESEDSAGIPDTIDATTDLSILFEGLSRAGFCRKRQGRVRNGLNIERFKAHYGVEPQVVQAIFGDIKDEFPTFKLDDFFMTLNWLKLYDTEHVLSGRWGHCEEIVRKKVKECAKKIQHLKEKKIVFGGFDEDEFFIITVDGVNFRTQEFRLDPSSKWFDHKTKSAGLTYELALSIRRNALVWINGPFPSGDGNDGTIYRGGKKDQQMDEWDKTSLFFKMPPNTRAVADSGYAGLPKITTVNSKHSKRLKKFLTRAKQRQESFHTKLKSFHVLEHRFRHGKSTEEKMALHKMCVEAVCVIAQYDLEYGHPVFEV